MIIKHLNDTDFKIFIFNKISRDLTDEIKDIIKKLQKKLNLKGFYKVIVISKSVGVFLKIIKLDDSFYKDVLELKIDIRDCDLYFKTKDYFIISSLSKVVYYDGYYYGLVDDYFDKVIEKVEFGEYVLEYDICNILSNCVEVGGYNE